MTIAIVATFILGACLALVGYFAHDFAIFDAKQRYDSSPLSNLSARPQGFLDSGIVLVSKLSFVGAFLSFVAFLALLLVRGLNA